MGFTNGIKSTLVRARNSGGDPDYTFQIDSTRDIRFVSFQIDRGTYYTGLRLYDDEYRIIIDDTWLSDGTWAPMQKIPAD